MPKYTDEEEKRVRDSFSPEDKAIAAQNPEYGDKLAQIKHNYNNASTDEERAGWHDEAEKLSRAYGYSRNADGTVLTPYGDAGAQAAKSNMQTIKAFDDKYALKDDKSGYQATINALLGDIMGAKFTYSAEDDPRYALAQEYARDAMKNQMAESAALSGGYGNSYAAAAGQQVYDDYMEKAAYDLEDRAYSRFQDAQAERYNRLGLLRDLDETAYSRAQAERSDQYQRERDAIADARYDDETEYSRLRDALSDARYDREYADSRADTAWSQNMTERQYEDSRADTMYSRAQEASAPRLDLDTALSMYASGVQSSEVMKTLQHYLGDNADAASLDAAALKSADETAEMDYEGLFSAALNDVYSPEAFIKNNYKKYGFSSSNGLDDAFESWRDISQDTADSYLESLSIPVSAVITKREFYDGGKKVKGESYASYADYIDAMVEIFSKTVQKFQRIIPKKYRDQYQN